MRATSAAERGDDFWGPRAISGLSWPKAPRPVRKQTNRGEKPNNDRKRGCDLIRWASQHITLPEAVLALTPTKSQEIIIAHPSPLSAPFAAYAVAVATEAASKAESLVIVTGSDLRAAFPATMIVRSCRSSGLASVRASPSQTTSNEGGRSDPRHRVAST